MKILVLLALCALTFLGGCSWFHSVATPPNINTAAYNASYYGLKAVLNNNPGRAPQICKDVTTGVSAVNDVLLNPPNGLLAGGTGTQVLASTLQTALSQLENTLPAGAIDPINIGLAVIEAAVAIPGLPTDALSSEAVADLTAGLQGLNRGLLQAVTEWQAAHPAPTPTPPMAATAPALKGKLVNNWAH